MIRLKLKKENVMKKRDIAISIVVFLLIIAIILVFYNPKESKIAYSKDEAEEITVINSRE